MWDKLLIPDVPLLQLLLRAVVVFVAVVVMLRLSGKRQVGQLGAVEFVVVLLISDAVQNSMNGGDDSLPGGLITAALLVALGALVSLLTFRSETMSRLLEGRPTRLVHDGHVIRSAMDRERLNDADLKVLLRKHGIHDFASIDEVILEADGSLSVTRKDEEEFQFPEAKEQGR
jgi:uncharacterized membrane protein YcaP (DUF421 family)